jgi:PTH1 family peptidyl-tRNA hydrolase
MKLIVGLGNPGKEYAGTRHNLGFEALDHLAEKLETSFKTDKKFQAEIAEAHIGSEKVLLAKPTTFMNLSGDAVQALKSFYKLENADILVLHDEMDYEPGKIAFSIGSGPAGHNGVESIQERLATKEIARLRLGIGRPTIEAKEDYVLGRPSDADRGLINSKLDDTRYAILDFVTKGLTKAMNVWNAVKSA